MFIALGALLGLISLSPAILILDGPILSCFIPLLASLGLIFTSFELPSVECQRFGKLIKPVIIAAAVPAIWMLLQLVPLPLSAAQPWTRLSDLANPVWQSVATGFRHSVDGSISVDIGATAIALVRYLSFIGVILLATAVTINRDRAEAVLIGLTAATVLIAFMVTLSEIFGLGLLAARDEALDCAGLGVVLSAACATFVFERHETRRAKRGASDAKFHFAAFAALFAFAICVAAIVTAHSGSIIFATTCGFVMFAAVIIVRRLDLGHWGAGAIGVTASVIAIALVTGAAGNSADPRLAFVKRDAASIALTQRILADAPLFGEGAGSFGALAPIYQSVDAKAGEREAATAAAQLSIEMGRPMLWFAVFAATGALLVLLRGASNRGRDSFYAAAGAASLAMLIVQAFINVGLYGSTLPLLGAVIVGLGLAQSQGRSSL